MTRTENILFLQNITWNNNLTKHQNILDYLKYGIRQRQLQEQLPSVRAMAEILGVNKNTVNKVMEELLWEEYISVIPKRGYVVNQQLVVQEEAQEQIAVSQKKLPIVFPTTPITTLITPYSIAFQDALNIQRWGKNLVRATKTNDINIKNLALFFNAIAQRQLKIIIKPEHSFIYHHNFWLKHILLQQILQENDQIIMDTAAIDDWPLKLLHKNITIIKFPDPKPGFINTLIKKIKQQDSIRCIILPHYQFKHTDIINLLSICYQYGILLLECQYIHQIHKLKRQHFAKSYDLNNYVIHLIHYPNNHIQIIADTKILDLIIPYTNPIDINALSYTQYLLESQSK